ncbi:hypothetical protein E2C01_057300 [Portunus trituberculatus]|uniref:Secreted protein n=1 Tax=Portunus trituberculatus TaxID=210409 RepID=A0A5B7H046_PORTR|nr:hypothetical protein [Portunus trituberculatus]
MSHLLLLPVPCSLLRAAPYTIRHEWQQVWVHGRQLVYIHVPHAGSEMSNRRALPVWRPVGLSRRGDVTPSQEMPRPGLPVPACGFLELGNAGTGCTGPLLLSLTASLMKRNVRSGNSSLGAEGDEGAPGRDVNVESGNKSHGSREV